MDVNGRRIVVFSGSNSQRESDFLLAEQLGGELARAGFVAVNGGGPGLMDALLRGAKQAEGKTFAVQLNKHQREQSAFADDYTAFDHLRPRQDALREMADGFMALPGGLGTVYEVMEVLALKNSGQLHSAPLILLSDHFRPLVSWLESMCSYGMVSKRWRTFFAMAETVPEGVDLLRKWLEKGCLESADQSLEFPPIFP